MKRNEKGQVLVLVALAIFALLGLAALGIDVGYMYSIRHELQRSADAGALAGASAIREFGRDCNDTTLNPNGRTTKAEAELRAIDYATRDDVAISRLNTVAGDIVTATCPDPVTNNPMRVRVDVQRTAPLFFARVLGRNNAAIPAFAVAEAFDASMGVECVVPWGIPVPWNDNNGNGIYDTGEDVHYPEDYPCVDVDPTLTTWDYATHTAGAREERDQYLCRGSLQVLKIGKPGEQMNPGNFLGLDLSGMGCGGNPGANFYYWMITHSCECGINISIDDTLEIDTKTGNMVQNTITAVAPQPYYQGDPAYLPNGWKNDPESLMNQDPGSVWVDDGAGGYPSGGDEIGNPRIVRLPIYDPNVTMDENGKFTFKSLGFVGFWIQDVVYSPPNNGSVVGRFVSIEGTGTNPGGNAGFSVLNIRLVE